MKKGLEENTNDYENDKYQNNQFVTSFLDENPSIDDLTTLKRKVNRGKISIPDATMSLLSYHVHDVSIPNRDNYFGMYDRVLSSGLLNVIKNE